MKPRLQHARTGNKPERRKQTTIDLGPTDQSEPNQPPELIRNTEESGQK